MLELSVRYYLQDYDASRELASILRCTAYKLETYLLRELNPQYFASWLPNTFCYIWNSRRYRNCIARACLPCFLPYHRYWDQSHALRASVLSACVVAQPQDGVRFADSRSAGPAGRHLGRAAQPPRRDCSVRLGVELCSRRPSRHPQSMVWVAFPALSSLRCKQTKVVRLNM